MKRFRFAALAALILTAGGLMAADVEVRKLTDPAILDAIVANDADLVPIVQSGTSKRATVGLFRSGLVSTGRTITTTAPLKIAGGTSADLSANRALTIDDASTSQKGAIELGGQLGGTATSQTVLGIRETSGPTNLTIGAISNGQVLTRSGSSIVGAAPSGGTVTSVTCGTGLTGGAITSSGTCAADFGTTSTKVAAGNSTSNGPTGTEYSAQRAPTSVGTGGCNESWAGGSAACSWSWGNQGSTSETMNLDSDLLSTPNVSGDQIRIRVVAAPASADWVATAYLQPDLVTTYNTAGIVTLAAGSLASPTKVETLGYVSRGDVTITHSTWTNYSTFSSDRGNFNLNVAPQEVHPGCLQFRYVTGSKTLSSYLAPDCTTWHLVASTVLSADPPYVGIFVNSNNATWLAAGRFYWFRLRTDATGTSTPYPAGS